MVAQMNGRAGPKEGEVIRRSKYGRVARDIIYERALMCASTFERLLLESLRKDFCVYGTTLSKREMHTKS